MPKISQNPRYSVCGSPLSESAMYGAIHKTLSVDEEQSATLINSVGTEQIGGRILYDSNAPIGYGTRSSEKRRMLIGFFIFIGITLVCIGAIDLFGSSSSSSSS